jgi:hypothetical protein
VNEAPIVTTARSFGDAGSACSSSTPGFIARFAEGDGMSSSSDGVVGGQQLLMFKVRKEIGAVLKEVRCLASIFDPIRSFNSFY